MSFVERNNGVFVQVVGSWGSCWLFTSCGTSGDPMRKRINNSGLLLLLPTLCKGILIISYRDRLILTCSTVTETSLFLAFACSIKCVYLKTVYQHNIMIFQFVSVLPLSVWEFLIGSVHENCGVWLIPYANKRIRMWANFKTYHRVSVVLRTRDVIHHRWVSTE